MPPFYRCPSASLQSPVKWQRFQRFRRLTPPLFMLQAEHKNVVQQGIEALDHGLEVGFLSLTTSWVPYVL